MKRLLLLFLLFFLFTLQNAGQLSLQITVSEGTKAVGTNVSLVSGGVEIESKRADQAGMASFEVSDGSYFVLLRRYSYPLHVFLVEVKGSTFIPLTMRQKISYSSAYGQIIGPSDFSNASVAAYSGGEIVRRAKPNKDGYYLLSYLPQGSYTLVFSSPGYHDKTFEIFLPESEFVYADAKMDRIGKDDPEEKLHSPSSAKQFSDIVVQLTKGGAPLARQAIDVQTPSGLVQIESGEDGKAAINAAEAGVFIFRWKNLSASTTVEPAEELPPAPTKPRPNEPPQTPQPAWKPEEAKKESPSAGSGALLVLAGAVVVFGALSALLLLFPRIFRHEEKKRKDKKHSRKW
ncbi:MAG: carboxypeptidase-like regulatory domain-containing protein [Candidatus Micrarchaeota archaeon]|nr:carboxypeptidase-like regulatory domain-containing protein [Candidatus Micrarchaeota archaeon]